MMFPKQNNLKSALKLFMNYVIGYNYLRSIIQNGTIE